MEQNFATPTLWTLNVPFIQSVVNGAYAFKYFVDIESATKKLKWSDGYERPASQGGGNRDITFQGVSNQQMTTVPYDDIKTDYVIPNGTNLQVKFSVDMAPATAPAVGFIPGTDTLYWIPEMPTFVYTQYVHDTTWTDTDTMKVLKLTDANNDSIYEGTLSVYAPSFNTFEYRYAFKHGGTWTHEPGGFGDDAYRIRFIGQSAARTFPENPYSMPTDIWTNAETKPDQELDPYTSLTLVRDEGNLIISTYELYQNYPNPFNPATTIKFNLASKQHVTLKIFNLLGQEVATLVNEELIPGAYTAKFDGAKLASGMYIYRITAGGFVESKTMVMVK